MWRRDQVGLQLREDLCAGDIVTLEVRTPAGIVLIMGEPEDVDRILVVRGVHVHSEPLHQVGIGTWA